MPGCVVESVVYEGEYKHHNRDGYGKYIIKFGSCVDEYEGEFKQGNLDGKEYTKTDGRGLVTEYKGDFRRNDLHGNGLMKYPGGVTHEDAEEWRKHGDILCSTRRKGSGRIEKKGTEGYDRANTCALAALHPRRHQRAA